MPSHAEKVRLEYENSGAYLDAVETFLTSFYRDCDQIRDFWECLSGGDVMFDSGNIQNLIQLVIGVLIK